MATFHFQASVLTEEASMWPDLVKAFADVEAGSQQFVILGPHQLIGDDYVRNLEKKLI
jgi:hypothetical protein